MYHHKLYSEFMSFIQGEVFVRSAFYKIFIYTKNINDLISNFESTQNDRVSNNHNNLMVTFKQNQIPLWSSAFLCFSIGHQPYIDWGGNMHAMPGFC